MKETMKNYKKTITMLLTAAVLLIAVFMTGCTKLSEAPNSTPSEVDAPAESDGFGVYVKLERDDASSIALHGGSSFTKVCENADGSLLKDGEWIFTGDDIVQLSQKDNCSILFTVSAYDADDMLLGEGTFLYDMTQEKLQFYGTLFGMSRPECENRAKLLLDRLDLTDAHNRKLATYSTGMRRRSARHVDLWIKGICSLRGILRNYALW